MITFLAPILKKLMASRSARCLLVEILETIVEQTDNDLDDFAIEAVRKALCPKKE